MTTLQGKTALVTGAGNGIGRAAAIAFADAGATVIATDVNDDALAGLAAERDAIATEHLDITDPAAISAIAARLGHRDVLMNCAGYVHHGTILDCDEDQWQFSFDVNARSMYRTIRAFLPAMLDAGGASIINVASMASSLNAAPNRFVYAASKAAVIGLTKAVACDFIKRGIRCNAICPGTIDSPSLADRINAFDDPVQARRDFIARQPMGRLGQPEEVAALAVFLASDASAFATGATHVIDGGFSL